jgi:hypothetical protein
MPMIHAETVKAINELLRERGIQQKENERLGDYVARGLRISESQAQAFLDALHEGESAEQARDRAGIPPEVPRDALLLEIARAVGSALGRVRNLAD